MLQKITKKIVLFDKEKDYVPTQLIEFQAFIQEKVNAIPLECLSSSVIEFESSSSSWDSSTNICISYTRQETDEEYKQRNEEEEKRIKRAKELKEMEEKRTYERLKKKYQKEE